MDPDLAEYSRPISTLFKDSRPDQEIELTEEKIQSYELNGYLAGVRILNNEQLDALRTELARLMEPGLASDRRFYEYHHNESSEPGQTLFHALGAWRVSPAFHDLIFHRAMTIPARQLLGGRVRFWHDQLFVKPAHDGGIVAWHQDYSYWTRTEPIAHLTCWIGLDDSTKENGCVHYVPGSHKWELLPRGSLADDMDAALARMPVERKRDFRPVAIELKAGYASFHHPMLIHGSYENRSGRPRRAAVVNMFRDGVRSASDAPLLEGVPAIPAGETIDGRFFPLLI